MVATMRLPWGFLLALSVHLLSATAMTPSINKEFKWKHPDPGQPAFVFSDCDDSQKIVVQQAITDALHLADDAARALFYDPMRPHWLRMFDKIFTDKTVTPRRSTSRDWASGTNQPLFLPFVARIRCNRLISTTRLMYTNVHRQVRGCTQWE